jgi:Sec-independent protein translocase protein TatA
MKELAYHSMQVDMSLMQLSKEMKEFKDEMKEFKDEMKDFKDEMRGFKDEMKGYKDENDRIIRKMNRQWGELANKMGTLAEDIVAPNIPRIARELFGLGEPQFFAVRVKRRRDERNREFDVIAAYDDYVLVNETKSSLNDKDVNLFVEALLEFREFFPEYQSCKIIGIIASLYVEQSLIRYCSAKGILVMAMGDSTMDILNKGAEQPY